jgi:hypothetical protein
VKKGRGDSVGRNKVLRSSGSHASERRRCAKTLRQCRPLRLSSQRTQMPEQPPRAVPAFETLPELRGVPLVAGVLEGPAMSDYRRWYIPGGMFSFTVVTYDRRPILITDEGRSFLHEAIETIRKRYRSTFSPRC